MMGAQLTSTPLAITGVLLTDAAGEFARCAVARRVLATAMIILGS